MRHAIKSLVISSLLFFISEKTFATNYVELVAGGTYECGYLKNGKNEVVDRHKHPIAGAEAKAQLNQDVRKLKSDQRKLIDDRTKISNSTKDPIDPSPKEIADYRSVLKFVKNLTAKQYQNTLPPLNLTKNRDDQIADLNALINQVNLQIANVNTERVLLEDCIKNKRIVFGNITIQALYVPTASDPAVVPLLLVPDNLLYGVYRIKHTTSATMCLKLPKNGGGKANFAAVFTKNPCTSYDPAYVPFMLGFPATDCSYIVPPNYLGWLDPSGIVNFGGTPNQTQLNAAQSQINASIGISEEGVYIVDGSGDPCLKNLIPVS